MNAFPIVDPIPLPAPVWLFKGLHILTLALHFITVEMIIGGLFLAVLLNLIGSRSASPSGALNLGASAALAKRLPIVMTYVINLGVPPLLFAQVLYGRALYTSSVLIGAYWIAVIPLLILCYWLLYRFAAGTEKGKAVWWIGGLSWLLAAFVAKIYSTNMTLMIRPEVWRDLYAADPLGAHLPSSDPILLPRLLFMVLGSLGITGLWVLWIASRKSIMPELRAHLCKIGGGFAMVGALLQGALLWWLFKTLPSSIQAELGSGAYQIALYCWIAGAFLCVATGAVALAKHTPLLGGYASALITLVMMASWTVFRDGLRDLTLKAAGFDVWNRTVVTNWSVVAIFFAVFVLGLAALAWLISVMARARPQMEGGLS